LKSPNPGKPEKIKIIYHENTKAQKYEKDHENFRAFVIGFIFSITYHAAGCGFPATLASLQSLYRVLIFT